jgi:uncharacterized repeat protein (TIGR01451 family)
VAVSPTTAGSLTNKVEAHSGESDTNADNNAATVTAGGVNQADLQMYVNGSNVGTVTVNDQINFQLSMVNAGPTTASNVVITDTLPAGAQLVAVTPITVSDPAGACATQDGVVTCTWSSVGNNHTVGASIGIRMSASGAVTNSASVTSASVDPDPSNNTSSFTVNVHAPPMSVTTAATLPKGNVGSAYAATLAASGGNPPYTWSIASGTLPAGLTLSEDGRISGTPTADGQGSFTVQASDLTAVTATKAMTLTIDPLPLCQSGPKVGVTVARDGSGGLTVTLTAQPSSSTPNNRLKQIQFTAATNARIDVPSVGGRAGVADSNGNISLVLSEQPTSVTFSVHRRAAGPTTVPLTVIDSCGSWKTFVGGGAAGF